MQPMTTHYNTAYGLGIALWFATACAPAPHGVAPAPAAAEPDTPGGEAQYIVDTVTGALLSPERAIAQLGAARVIYVAEQPDAPLHHEVQLQVIDGLLRQGDDIAIGLEMVARGHQATLDRWVAGELPEEQLVSALAWAGSWSADFGDYRAIFARARDRRIPLFALGPNPSAKLAGAPGTRGASDVHESYLRSVHASLPKGTRGSFEAFRAAEANKDDAMVAALLEELDGRTARLVVLASRTRVEYGLGVPVRVYSSSREPFQVVLPVVRGHLARYHKWLKKLGYPEKRADLFWETLTDPHTSPHHHHDDSKPRA